MSSNDNQMSNIENSEAKETSSAEAPDKPSQYSIDQILVERKKKLIIATVVYPLGILLLAMVSLFLILYIMSIVNVLKDGKYEFFFGLGKLRDIDQSQYSFAIVALTALQATIFIAAQNRAHSKNLPLAQSILSDSLNSFSKIFSASTAVILIIISVISFGDFTAFICLFLFWVSASICGLFSDDLTLIQKNLLILEGDLEFYKKDNSILKNARKVSPGFINSLFKFVKRFIKSSSFLFLLTSLKLVILHRCTTVYFILIFLSGVVSLIISEGDENPVYFILRLLIVSLIFLVFTTFPLTLHLDFYATKGGSNFELLFLGVIYWTYVFFGSLFFSQSWQFFFYLLLNILLCYSIMNRIKKGESKEVEDVFNILNGMKIQSLERAIEINKKIEKLNSSNGTS